MEKKDNKSKKLSVVNTLKSNFINEALDSNVDVKWEKGKNWIGYFNTQLGKKFKIEINEDLDKIKGITPYAFKFTRWNEITEKWDMTLTNSGEEQFLVFGTLAKALFEFIDEVKPNILFFIGNEERKSLYKKLGWRAAQVKSTLYGFDDFNVGNDYVFALISNNVPAETTKYIRDNIKDLI